VGAEVKSMEVKKPQQAIATERSFSLKRAQDFVSDVKSEIQKITWTNREELIAYTKIVVGATFVFGMAIYLLDLMIQGTLGTLNFLLHLISG
jgi:preprotein translocase subunit SecE